MSEFTLDVQGLSTHFFTRAGVVKAVDDISFRVARGRVLGLVGESGSGKSVTGFSLIGLVDAPGRITSGKILFQGRDLTKLDLVELQDLRYSSPESVLTSKDIDERSLVFAAGLLISELILGRPLLTANTKMNYIYELCKLFPEESIAEGEQQSRVKPGNEEDRFETVIGQYNFSN